jgi:hypothetical protein
MALIMRPMPENMIHAPFGDNTELLSETVSALLKKFPELPHE